MTISMKTIRFCALFFPGILFLASPQAQTIPDTLTYSRKELLIPMRDGVRLNTVIFTPSNAGEPLPLIFLRTPQKYVPNIFDAQESDFIITHQKIYRSAKYPTHIKLPVNGRVTNSILTR